jgi:hypothetical protein
MWSLLAAVVTFSLDAGAGDGAETGKVSLKEATTAPAIRLSYGRVLLDIGVLDVAGLDVAQFGDDAPAAETARDED